LDCIVVTSNLIFYDIKMAYASNVAKLQDSLENLTAGKVQSLSDLEEAYQSRQNTYAEEESIDKAKGGEYQSIGIGLGQGELTIRGFQIAKKRGIQKLGELTGELEEKAKPIKEAVKKLGDVQESAFGTVNDLADASDNLYQGVVGTANELASNVGDFMRDPVGGISRMLRQPTANEIENPAFEGEGSYDGREDAQADDEEDVFHDAPESIQPHVGETNPSESIEMDSFNANDIDTGNTISDAVAGTETSDALATTTGADVGADIVSALPEAAAVTDLIPGVGEAALAATALVGIGEGLYHLFKHHKKPTAPVPPTAQSFEAPTMLTQKFSSAIPSLDTAIDRSGAMTNF